MFLGTQLVLPTGPTKALSLKQPFAWLIANGYLLVDDRTWGTQYRGPVLIHASKGLYKSQVQQSSSGKFNMELIRHKMTYVSCILNARRGAK